MSRYTPYTWADDPSGGTPITAARLNAIEAGIDLDIPVADIDATGTPSSSTYLRGDGTWATPAGGGGGAVDSVNGQTGTVVLDQDDVGDGTTYKQFSATEKTKLASVATGATANDTDANLKNRANHTGTQSADTITDGTTNKAYTATEKTKLASIATGATANDTDANLKNRANHTGTQPISSLSTTGTASSTTFLRGDGSWATPSGGSGFSRATASHTTASLANLAIEKSTINMAASFDLFEITADRACRVRLYRTTAQRDADETRPIGTLPTDTDPDHGCFLEVIFTSADSYTIGPGARGFLNSGIAVPISVTNMSGSSAAVDVDILYLPKE